MITLDEQIEYMEWQILYWVSLPTMYPNEKVNTCKAILSTLEKVRDSKQAHACVGEWVERKKPSTE